MVGVYFSGGSTIEKPGRYLAAKRARETKLSKRKELAESHGGHCKTLTDTVLEIRSLRHITPVLVCVDKGVLKQIQYCSHFMRPVATKSVFKT